MSLISKEHLSLTLQAIKNLLSKKADKSELEEEISKVSKNIVQSDWNQSDENAADFVKNRTHYVEVREKVILEEVKFSTELIDDRIVWKNNIAHLFNEAIVGDIYNVYFNGELYKIPVKNHYICGKHLGNTSILFNATDSGEPFCISLINASGAGVYTEQPMEATLKITSGEPDIIHQLDEKYIPDTIARVSDVVVADWNQSDENAADFVKNRTHYIEINERVLLEKISFTTEATNEGRDYEWSQPTSEVLKNLQVGEICHVYFNDIKYSLPVKNHFAFGKYLGSSDIHSSFANRPDSDEPFCIVLGSGGGILCVYTKEASDITLEITQGEPDIIHQLDEKFIPDTIARVSDVVDMQVQSDWDQNDENAVNYVKNRPFYSKPYVIDRTFNANNSDGHTSYDLELVNLLWDNADKAIYTLEKIGQDPQTYTNPTIIELSPVLKRIEITWNYYININKETGLFFFGEPTGGGWFVSGSIYLNVEQIVQLDEKYIPDTIARVDNIPDAVPVPSTASVGQTIVVKTVDENGKPTEWEAVDPWVITSSTEGSTKRFKLTIGDDGVLTATEIVKTT